MISCYRSMPRLVGEFLDGVYQHPILIVGLGLAIAAVAGMAWMRLRKAQ